MVVAGECPSAGAIWSDVKAIVPAHDLGRVTAARIEVSDLGSTYHVRIVSDDGERQRTFRDPEHDCDHRGRFAAVFIVVTLLPPDVLLEAPPEVAPTPSVPPVAAPPTVIVVAPPPPAVPAPKRFWIEAAALFDAAPAVGSGAESSTLGGELRFLLGAQRLVAVAGVGFQPRASFNFGTIGVDELRIPFDLGAAFVHTWSHLSLVGQAGLAGAVVRISGSNTASPDSGTRLDLGGRIAVAARFGSSSSALVPVFGIHALVFPKPYEPTVMPQGTVGQLPALWVGVTAGMSFAP